jgi:hypothetical protein
MLRVACIAFALVGSANPLVAPAGKPAAPPDPLVDSVRRAFVDYEARLNSGDYAGAILYYADDSRADWVEQEVIRPRRSC